MDTNCVKPAQRQGKKERPTGKLANLSDGASFKPRTVNGSGDTGRRVNRVRVSSQAYVIEEKLTEQVRFRETAQFSKRLEEAAKTLGLSNVDLSAMPRVAFRLGVQKLEELAAAMSSGRGRRRS